MKTSIPVPVISMDRLADFIVAGKKACYANEDFKPSMTRRSDKKQTADGAVHYIYADGDLTYTDVHYGGAQAHGRELVTTRMHQGTREQTIPVWQMNYSASILPTIWEDSAFADEMTIFLKQRLNEVSPETPFRGIEGTIKHSDWVYSARTESVWPTPGFPIMKSFEGRERIEHREKDGFITVFRTNYSGGLIVPKGGRIILS